MCCTCGLCCLGSPGGVVAGLLTPGGAGFTKGLSGVVVGVDGALLGLGIRGIPGFNCGLKWNCSYINNCKDIEHRQFLRAEWNSKTSGGDF